jgi:hypothetical protein
MLTVLLRPYFTAVKCAYDWLQVDGKIRCNGCQYPVCENSSDDGACNSSVVQNHRQSECRILKRIQNGDNFFEQGMKWASLLKDGIGLYQKLPVPLDILSREYWRGEVSLYCWPPVLLVWNQLYDNWQVLFLFAKQTNANQSNRRAMVWWSFPL